MEWGCISPTGIATVWTSKARGHFGGNHRHHVLVILSSRSQMVGGFSMSPISDDEHCLSLPLIPRPNVLLKELEKAGKEPPSCIQRSIFFLMANDESGELTRRDEENLCHLLLILYLHLSIWMVAICVFLFLGCAKWGNMHTKAFLSNELWLKWKRPKNSCCLSIRDLGSEKCHKPWSKVDDDGDGVECCAKRKEPQQNLRYGICDILGKPSFQSSFYLSSRCREWGLTNEHRTKPRIGPLTGHSSAWPLSLYVDISHRHQHQLQTMAETRNFCCSGSGAEQPAFELWMGWRNG